MTTAPAPSPPQILADVPCLRCHYNLRGVDPSGQCPECGHLNHVSLLAWEEDRRARPPIRESDPRWIRAVAEGMRLAAIVFVLMVALAFAPAFMYEWKTTPRKWTLGVACAMWVLAWAAAWKLSNPEPHEEPRGRRTRRVLRVTATMYLAFPFIWGLAPQYNAGWEFIVPVLTSMFAGLVATVAWFLHLGRLAASAGDVTGPIEARLLLFANVVAFLFCLTSDFGGPDSLSQMLHAYLAPSGSVAWLRELRRDFDYRATSHVFTVIGAAVALWNAVLAARLALRFRAAATRSKGA
jgi:hypothetical protein